MKLDPMISLAVSRLLNLERSAITLSVRSPKAKFNTPSTAAVLVEHHRGRARVHGVVPIEPAHRIESAIHFVDTNITDHDRGVILGPIFGHGLI